MIDYINELREACLEAYTGIIQGLKGDDEKAVSCKYLVHTRLQHCWDIVALFLTHSRSITFMHELQCLLYPNPLSPVSMLFDVFVHTRKSNGICINVAGEGGFMKNAKCKIRA